MPKLNGHQATKLYRAWAADAGVARKNQAWICLLTGDVITSHESLRDMGFDNMLTKPCKESLLRRVLTERLGPQSSSPAAPQPQRGDEASTAQPQPQPQLQPKVTPSGNGPGEEATGAGTEIDADLALDGGAGAGAVLEMDADLMLDLGDYWDDVGAPDLDLGAEDAFIELMQTGNSHGSNSGGNSDRDGGRGGGGGPQPNGEAKEVVPRSWILPV